MKDVTGLSDDISLLLPVCAIVKDVRGLSDVSNLYYLWA